MGARGPYAARVSPKDAWRRQVERHFGFLSEHGYEVHDVDNSGFWEITVTYAAAENAVIVRNSREFQRVEIELARLTESGAVPPVAIWTGPESDGRALLDTVLEARGVRVPRRLGGTAGRSADRALSTWARLLVEHVGDFLTGSTQCIEEAHQVVLARVRNEPQVLTINLPVTASPQEAEAAVAEARAVTPEFVNIRVHRYGPRGRGRNK